MVDQKFASAVHVMTLLAFEKCENGRLFTSEQIAKSVRTNPTVVRRLIAKLVDAKILKSHKGKRGGVELAKCPSEISLREIYEAVSDKTLLAARCSKAHGPCPTSRAMGKLMLGVIQGFEENSKSYLQAITLQDLAGQVEA
jgi:Rrf2 family protein